MQDYEKKIEADRDENFIDRLFDSQQRSSEVGNRFMSPVLRLSTEPDAHNDFG